MLPQVLLRFSSSLLRLLPKVLHYTRPVEGQSQSCLYVCMYLPIYVSMVYGCVCVCLSLSLLSVSVESFRVCVCACMHTFQVRQIYSCRYKVDISHAHDHLVADTIFMMTYQYISWYILWCDHREVGPPGCTRGLVAIRTSSGFQDHRTSVLRTTCLVPYTARPSKVHG